MRSCILLTILIDLLLCSAGCKTADIDPFNELYGIWEWVKSSGGFGGWTITPASEGYTKSLCFDKKGNFLMLKNKCITRSGRYTIIRRESMLLQQPYDMIIFDYPVGLVMPWIIISLTSNQVILMEDCYDCFSHTYKK